MQIKESYKLYQIYGNVHLEVFLVDICTAILKCKHTHKKNTNLNFYKKRTIYKILFFAGMRVCMERKRGVGRGKELVGWGMGEERGLYITGRG